MLSRASLILLLCQWKNTFAEDCVAPELPNGQVTGSGDTRSWTGTFSCDPGFVLVTRAQLKCRDGVWSDPAPPACTALGGGCDKSDLPVIANGRSFPYQPRKFRGSVYKFKCNRGYKRWGHSLVHCTGNNWDFDRVPICHVTSCPLEDMTSVLGGRAVTRAEGGLLFYQCSAPGAVMAGSPSLVCTQRGWNDTKPECQFGPSTMDIRGPASIMRGEAEEYECEAGPSNPVSEITWQLVSHEGEAMDHLLQVSSESSSLEEEGLVSVSRARVRVPSDQAIVGLRVSCRTEARGNTEARDKTISVHFGPIDLSIKGPAVAQTQSNVEVTCQTTPSVPAAQVSWIISSEVTHIVSGETVHQEKDGSFVTMSTMNLFIPDTEHAEDVVVECVAKHDTLLHEDIAAVHVIKVSNSRTTATTTTERDAVDSLIDVNEDEYSYEEEDEEYYEEAYNEVENTFNTDSGLRSPKSHEADVAVNIYKYQVESQEQTRGDTGNGNVTHLVSLDEQHADLIYADEGDQTKSPDYKAGAADTSELTFSKSETFEPKSYSSLKLDTASMSTKTVGGDNIEPEVPMKASHTKSMSAAATVPFTFSFVSLVLPMILSLKYFL